MIFFIIILGGTSWGTEKRNIDINVSVSNKLSFEDYLQLMGEKIYQWTFGLPEGKYKIDIYAENYNSESSKPEKISLKQNVDYMIDVVCKKPITLILRLPSQKDSECKLLLKYFDNTGSIFSQNLLCQSGFDKLWSPSKENQPFFCVSLSRPKILLNTPSYLLYMSFGNNNEISFKENNNQPSVKLSKQGRIVLFCLKIESISTKL